MSISDDTEKLYQIRAGLSITDDKAFLNTGSMGPLSLAAVKAARREISLAGKGKYGENPFLRLSELLPRTKLSIAGLINASPTGIAITGSTTNGIYNVLQSLNWEEGDEVITSDKEHFAVIVPLLQLREQSGIKIRYFKTEPFETADFESLITERTKLVALSHVSFSTGEVLPLEDIVELAHKRGIPVLADGAQSAGAIPIDVKELDVDYYSLPGQKWLNGPRGTGALYVTGRIIEHYRPFVNEEANPYPYEAFKVQTNIRRYEPALPADSALAGFGASVEWLLDSVGVKYAYKRIQELGQYLRTALSGIEGITVATPYRAAGLTSFRADFADAKEILEYLRARGILTRTVEPFGYVRVSTSYFNTKEEIDSLIKAIISVKEKGRVS